MLTIDGQEMPIIMDSGSDITLISTNALQKMAPRPKPRTGETIELGQVAGKLKINSYIELPIFFITKKGPIRMDVEAYVVSGMSPDFILGNDFAEQYQISIDRSGDGTKVIFGDSGRSMDAKSAVHSTEELHSYQARHVIQEPNPLPPKTPPFKSKNLFYLEEDESIRSESGKVVRICAKWPEFLQEAYLENIQTPPGIEVMEAIVPKLRQEVVIFNSGKQEVKLVKGTPIGKLLDPNRSLDKPTEERTAVALALKAIVKGFGKEENPITEDNYPAEREGGPKTAELEPDDIPSEKFFEVLDVNPDLPTGKREQVKEILWKRRNAFGLDGRLGNLKTQFEIRLKEGAEPVSKKPYHASPRNREVIEKQMEKWLKLGVVEPSKSPWGFPVVIVFRNGKPRFCVDYRDLNKLLKFDQHPLPLQEDIRNALVGAVIFSILDALAGFNQMNVKYEDREKTAFRMHLGLYQFVQVPFGIQSGPAAFQRIMQETLAPWLWIFTLVYIDDIITYSKSFEDHLIHLDKVLGAIEKSGLTLAPDKCHIAYESIQLLGQKVSRLGMSTVTEKVEAIDALAQPTNVKSLQSFIGMMGYYANYIPYYAWIMTSLFKLLRKDAKWKWEEEEKNTFEVAKSTLKASPILAYPIPGNGYRLYTDASRYGIAAVLQQVQKIQVKDLKGTRIHRRLKELYDKGEPLPELVSKVPDGFENPREKLAWASSFEETYVFIERVDAYWARVLKKEQRNYSAMEIEVLAGKEALLHFQAIIEGELIVLITDHSALTWASVFSNYNTRLTKWGMTYAAFPGLNIVHRAGRVHSNVDPLSRMKRNIPFFESPVVDPSRHIHVKSLDEEERAPVWKKLTYEQIQENRLTSGKLKTWIRLRLD
jgi:Reverse transcriptase (RNA-dependent DNA polymerase)/RNase H-like domain found in reverse transcriptase/Aspartyl protease